MKGRGFFTGESSASGKLGEFLVKFETRGYFQISIELLLSN